jgi:hypothetical protein
MTINAQNRLLPDWFSRVRTRQTVLPRFQRFEAWGHANVTQMFNTILRRLPLGAVLILEIGNEEPFISRPIVGAPTDGERITEHLLDGQQRLTALWRGLHNNYEDRTYFLYLTEDEDPACPTMSIPSAAGRKRATRSAGHFGRMIRSNCGRVA